MENIENLKQLIAKSSWSNSEKELVASLLSSVGPAVLDFLERELSRGSSFELEKNSMLISFLSSQQAYEDFKANYDGALISLFKAASTDPDYAFGRYVIPLLLDVKKAAQQEGLTVSAELHEAIINFQLEVFKYLPKEVLLDMLKSDLLLSASKTDLVKEFKKYLYYNATYYDDNWGVSFNKAMQGNEEMLGKNPIMVDGKQIPPTVKNWIGDFIAFSSRPTADRSAFDAVQYLTASRGAASLTTGERQLLFELLNLFGWLLSPSATTQEIEMYENESVAVASKSSPIPPSSLGISTPASVLQRQASRPSLAPSESLAQDSYKEFAQKSSQRAVSLQDILNQRDNDNQVFADTRVGISFRDNQAPKPAPQVKIQAVKPPVPASPPPKTPEAESSPKPISSDIDKKLEELKKRKFGG